MKKRILFTVLVLLSLFGCHDAVEQLPAVVVPPAVVVVATPAPVPVVVPVVKPVVVPAPAPAVIAPPVVKPTVVPVAVPKPALKLPGASAELLPILNQEIDLYWNDLIPRAFPAGVIDQESNWKPAAQLKTARELGCGLGQFTIAYSASGAVRFDALTEAKGLDKSLKDWDWRDCGAVKYQMRAVILKLKVHDRNCSALMAGNLNTKYCAGAQYNGGAGSFNTRIRTCRMTPGCDHTLWLGNLEKQCPQSNTKVAGYGESFCMINSKYPGRVFDRMPKFEPYMLKETKKETP